MLVDYVNKTIEEQKEVIVQGIVVLYNKAETDKLGLFAYIKQVFSKPIKLPTIKFHNPKYDTEISKLLTELARLDKQKERIINKL